MFLEMFIIFTIIGFCWGILFGFIESNKKGVDLKTTLFSILFFGLMVAFCYITFSLAFKFEDRLTKLVDKFI